MQQSSRHPLVRIVLFFLSGSLTLRFLILLFVSSQTFAEPFLGYDSSITPKHPITLSQLETPVTPTDFKSLVKSKGEKNRQALKQQLKEEFSKQPAPPPPSQTGAAAAAPLPVTPPPIPGTDTSVSQSPPAATAGTTPAPAFSASPPGASPPASSDFGTQAPPAQPGEGVYTGFGAGGGTTQGTGTPPPPPIPSSGGWNIKY